MGKRDELAARLEQAVAVVEEAQQALRALETRRHEMVKNGLQLAWEKGYKDFDDYVADVAVAMQGGYRPQVFDAVKVRMVTEKRKDWLACIKKVIAIRLMGLDEELKRIREDRSRAGVDNGIRQQRVELAFVRSAEFVANMKALVAASGLSDQAGFLARLDALAASKDQAERAINESQRLLLTSRTLLERLGDEIEIDTELGEAVVQMEAAQSAVLTEQEAVRLGKRGPEFSACFRESIWPILRWHYI